MGLIDTFGEYVASRMDLWGREFSLARNFEYLGHQSKNMLQILIEHRGEMPARATGYKPLEVPMDAQLVEDIVADIARDEMQVACVLRAYYCGRGRRKWERWETANLLLANQGLPMVNQRRYMAIHHDGLRTVRGALLGLARAA